MANSLASQSLKSPAASHYDEDVERHSELSHFLQGEDAASADSAVATAYVPSSSGANDGKSTYSSEVWVFAKYVAPIFVNAAIRRYTSSVGPVASMGQTGPLDLAGAALGSTTINLLSFMPAFAIGSSLDTLSTQAHGGQKSAIGQQDLNRLYCLRALMVMGLSITFLIPLICSFEPIFLLFNIEPVVAHVAARYLQCASIGIPAFNLYECLRRYCQAQGEMTGPAVAVGVAAVPTVILYNTRPLGLYTAPLALGIFFNLMFLVELIYVYCTFPAKCFRDWPSWKIIAGDLKPVLKLSAAGLITIGSDFFAWESLSFASAYFGSTVLAANAILLSTAMFFISLPSALMQASATRVGNHLGSNHPRDARCAALTAQAMGVALASTTALVLAANSGSWSRIFTTDPEVTAIVQVVMPFFCVICFLDGLQAVCFGILQGAGLVLTIARTNAIGLWMIGIPLAAVFAFWFNGGLLGLWSGLGIGLLIVSLRVNYLVVYNDWQSCARAAQERLRATSERASQVG